MLSFILLMLELDETSSFLSKCDQIVLHPKSIQKVVATFDKTSSLILHHTVARASPKTSSSSSSNSNGKVIGKAGANRKNEVETNIDWTANSEHRKQLRLEAGRNEFRFKKLTDEERIARGIARKIRRDNAGKKPIENYSRNIKRENLRMMRRRAQGKKFGKTLARYR
jgi:hypothetical protein